MIKQAASIALVGLGLTFSAAAQTRPSEPNSPEAI